MPVYQIAMSPVERMGRSGSNTGSRRLVLFARTAPQKWLTMRVMFIPMSMRRRRGSWFHSPSMTIRSDFRNSMVRATSRAHRVSREPGQAGAIWS